MILKFTFRDQPTVTFPIGDHVNVLHDYKKTGPSSIKLLTCRYHHLIDMLVEFCQNHTRLTRASVYRAASLYELTWRSHFVN